MNYATKPFAKHLDDGKQIAEYANWEIIGGIGGAIGSLVVGFIVVMFGFPTLFMSLLALVSSMLVITQPRELL